MDVNAVGNESGRMYAAACCINATTGRYPVYLSQFMAKLPSEWKLIPTLPEDLKSNLKSIEKLEAELSRISQENSSYR